ncbi:Outer membrane protein A precursor [Marinobacter salarius]|uniref:OmpA family protein n=1 Tax=Marinobacter salarius TaxID=1420917 RepID=UPI00125A0B46|nr:OmpA family protein [Marinobacter salarius]VVT18825.1 Outer membrane protein A [Marinobacter salarius]VXB92032.1 Outer membrane protein A precursor [Marinobacter salarius]
MSPIGWMCVPKSVVGIVAIFSFSANSTELPFPDKNVQPTELGATPLRVGRDHSILNLGNISSGMSGSQVEGLLGPPADSTSHGNLSHWHYNVNFPIAGGDSELVCQYKIVFRPDGTVESTHWRRHTCENLAQTLTAAPPAEAKPEPKVQVVTLSADILFGFGESELTSQGKDRLREVAENLQAAYQNPMVTLIGHTDRLGSFDSNMDLSQRRAEAVRRQLAKSGLSNSEMIAEGRGEMEPVVVCQTDQVEELKQCLQPNRRVDIEVFERQVGDRSL